MPCIGYLLTRLLSSHRFRNWTYPCRLLPRRHRFQRNLFYRENSCRTFREPDYRLHLASRYLHTALTTWWVESLSQELTGQTVNLDTFGLLIKTITVVILPIVTGVLLNRYSNRGVKNVEAYTPFLAVLSIVFIVDFILAAKKDAILEIGTPLIVAVVLLYFFGFLLGYILSRGLKLEEKDAQTISIEVGMQSSELATELARSNFSNYALATVPGAISALTHCILGSIAAGLCRARKR